MSEVFQHTLKRKKGALDELAVVDETSLQPTWRRVWCALAQYQDEPSWAQLGMFKLLMEMQISTAWFDFRQPKEPKEKQFKCNKIFPSLSKLNLGQSQLMPVWVFFLIQSILLIAFFPLMTCTVRLNQTHVGIREVVPVCINSGF